MYYYWISVRCYVQNIPERVKSTVMNGIGLSVVVLGVKMGLESDQFLIVIISLVLVEC